MNAFIKKISPVGIGCGMLFLSLTQVSAQEPVIDDKARQFCKDIVANIYNEILARKDQYSELADFDENVLYENTDGIYTIVYEYPRPQAAEKRVSYAMGVSIIGLDNNLFQEQKRVFELNFPLLGVKIIGYQPKYLKESQFDVMPIIRKYTQQLSDFQQRRLPLRLSIEPVKKVCQVGEEILFDVVLKNVGNEHLFVKTLGSSTLFFLLNNARWGTQPSDYSQGGDRVILRINDELRVRFKGNAYLHPGKVSIYGVYNVGIKGVKPCARSEITISE